MPNTVVLEFNEVNQRVLQNLISRGALPNFKRLVEHGFVAQTVAREEYSKLEPWIQWVSVHSGKTQAQHRAFNLSDGQHSGLQTIWDVLEKRGVPCGVVSPMNAARGAIRRGFYVPDPWSVSKDSYPEQLHPIYQFLAQQVQQHNISLEKGGSKLIFLWSCLAAGVPPSALARLGASYASAKVDKRNKWKLVAAFDRFLWDVTDALRRKYKTEFTSVFMNAVAHFQHHYWTEHQPDEWRGQFPTLFSKTNPVSEQNLHPGDDPVSYGLQTYDEIVGLAIEAVGIDSVVVVTGLSQIPFEGYAEGSGFYLYRPIDHDRLFDALNLRCKQISPLMSRDVMLYFDDDARRIDAVQLLESAAVNGRPVFHYTLESELRLFVKVIYSYEVGPDSVVSAIGLAKSLPWSDFFTLITFKTGHHHPQGTVIAPKRSFDDSMLDGQPIPIERMPELFLRAMDVDNPASTARELSLSPV